MMRLMVPVVCGVLALSAIQASAVEAQFVTPTYDQWQYWMNPSEGSRITASVFGAVGSNGLNNDFNDRDGVTIIAWDTSGLIATSNGPESYDVRSVRVSVSSAATTFVVPAWPIDLTLDEWYTYDANGDGSVNSDGLPRGDASDTDGESDDADPGRPIELYGAGFGPFYTIASWTETSGYRGAGQTTFGYDPFDPRDPFPFVYQGDTATMLHVEDNIRGLHNNMLAKPVMQFTPQPWAIGAPQDYVPGSQAVPFDIEFDVDLSLSGGRVKRYFQDQLDDGLVFLVVTTLKETTPFGGDPNSFPILVTKEGVSMFPGSHAPRLTVALADQPGDYDGDGDLTDLDFEAFPPCVTGPGAPIVDPQCEIFDFDSDADVDLADYDMFQPAVAG